MAATFFAIRYHFVPSFFPPTIFLVMNSLGIVVFGALVAAGVVQRHRPEWHKRLMLSATVSILGPGLGRFLPMDSFGAFAPLVMFGVICGFAFAGPIADLVVSRRIHPAYFWSVGAILLSNLLIPPLAFSPPAQAALHLLRGG